MLRTLFLLLLTVAIHPRANAQDDGLVVYSRVINQWDSLPLSNSRITLRLIGQDAPLSVLKASSAGKYSFSLGNREAYMLHYSAPGKVSKCVEIDTRNTPDSIWAAGLFLSLELSLFDSVPGVDFSLLDDPIGRARYDAGTGHIEFDEAYTAMVRDRIREFIAAYKKRKEESSGKP